MNGKSWLISGVVVLLIGGWMASGYLLGEERTEQAGDAAPREDVPRMSVQVRESAAETIVRRLEGQGEAIPDREVEIRAETDGRVAEILAERGAEVSAGDPIARLEMDDREARLARAEAQVAQYAGDYEAARQLGDRGLSAGAEVRQAFAALQNARAEFASIREEIENVTIRAPFDGVVDRRGVEVGDYLSAGDPVAQVVDVDPLRIVLNVAQQDVRRVEPGTAAEVRLASGETLDGEVTFIAQSGDRETRTFRVEVAAANPDGLPAGLSATVTLPLDELSAHLLSPAVLALDESGTLGAKAVNAEERVEFHPVEVVRSEPDGIWVTGLPERLRLITVGQGYIAAGDQVRAVEAEDSPVRLDSPRGPEPVPGAEADL